MRRFWRFGLAVVVVAVAGCGGGSSHGSTAVSVGSTSTAPGPTTAPPVTTEPTTHVPTTKGPATTAMPTTRPVLTTTSVPSGTTAACRQSDLEATTTTDRPSYPSNVTVTVTVTVHNKSSSWCQIANPYPQGATLLGSPIEIVDTNGNTVWQERNCCPGVAVIVPPKRVPPGGSYTWATVQWDQHSCPSGCELGGSSSSPEGPLVPPGAYGAMSVEVMPAGPAPEARFQVT